MDPTLALLRELASSPRATGGSAIAAARARCAEELRGLGFVVAEQPFTYSAFPGRFATPVLGAIGALLVGTAGWLAASVGSVAPALVLVAGVPALALSARWLANPGVMALPLLRERGANLEAALPGEPARVWLSAHLDTKSQPVSALIRSAGVMLETAGMMLALVAAAAGIAGAQPRVLWAVAGAVTLAGAAVVGIGMVGSRSPGALDNASGVATVIAATRLLGGRRGVGVLITDAEELGLAGARAWAARCEPAVVLNCDGVDDHGDVVATWPRRPPEGVTRAVVEAGRTTGVRVTLGRMLPGVLTDASAFADAGLPALTFSRGSVRSLLRVHTRRDDLLHLRGDGIGPTAAVIAEAARILSGERAA